jgi:hypothetical protein
MPPEERAGGATRWGLEKEGIEGALKEGIEGALKAGAVKAGAFGAALTTDRGAGAARGTGLTTGRGAGAALATGLGAALTTGLGAVWHLQRQYLYFCTHKASKLSTRLGGGGGGARNWLRCGPGDRLGGGYRDALRRHWLRHRLWLAYGLCSHAHLRGRLLHRRRRLCMRYM